MNHFRPTCDALEPKLSLSTVGAGPPAIIQPPNLTDRDGSLFGVSSPGPAPSVYGVPNPLNPSVTLWVPCPYAMSPQSPI